MPVAGAGHLWKNPNRHPIYPIDRDDPAFPEIVKDGLGMRFGESTMPWIFLIAAGALEIVWAIGLKQSDGFTRLIPSSITIIAMLGSFGLLGWAIRDLPIGVAYAVWTGIGTLGVVLISALWLREGLNLLQILCVLAIGGGIVGLKMLTRA